MVTSTVPQVTDFTRDILGRYVCNGLDEALRSADKGVRPDARPFDIIVIGGGTFGSVLAQDMFYRDKTHSHRILVLEGGPFVLPEHVQNLPLLGLNPPGATSIAQLRQDGQFGPDKPQEQVWGLPWHSSTPFPGLAYCLGGRSLFWGGWSPQPLDSEMPKDQWPSNVVRELNELPNGYFRKASEQLGVTVTNDFIFGPLHEALRQRLFEGINAGKVTDAIALRQLPLHLDEIPRINNQDLFKLEAPLAVQSRTRSGFFPFNKFSAIPLLMKAARAAWSESGGDDVKKRLMVVPHCHIKRLVMAERVVPVLPAPKKRWEWYVKGVETNLGYVPVPDNGMVIIALATIESTRLVLASFNIPSHHLIGHNLMAHLRSNLTIRIAREALTILDQKVKDLQASALFVKGRHRHTDGTLGHFHLQITASGLGALGTDSEAELFKKVPDIDGFDQFRMADDTHVVITIRGIGEMEPQNPNSHVTLDSELDEFGVPRAFVSIANPQDPQQRASNPKSVKDFDLWNAMDKAADDVAKVFAGNQRFEVFTTKGIVNVSPGDDLRAVLPYTPVREGGRRDGLGTTHHEAGTLWMGENPDTSVTNPEGRLHGVTNAYVAAPALFPTIGSPNPMLTGTAIARRQAQHVVPVPTPSAPSDGFQSLFDGFTVDNWRMAGKGKFIVVDGTLESVAGEDLGLYWCTVPMPPDYILRLEWLRWRHDDNSGVFIRFPHPDSKSYNNTAYVAVHFGFEVQIDELGKPDAADIHKTGAIYNEPGQNLFMKPAHPAGEWNEFEIKVQGQTYTVFLNGAQITKFTNSDPNRGLPSRTNVPSFIGLQSHTGRIAFRNIRFKKL